jgi:hypothetical protein
MTIGSGMTEEPAYASELRRLVGLYWMSLGKLDELTAHRRPVPGKWSIAEVIGHLVDSASNNHQRFLRGRWQDDLVFVGYDQDAWVAAQRYQDADWQTLLELWRAFNLHIAHVMERTPAEIRRKPYISHNLHRVGFREIAATTPATLDWFMEDYVEHLKHHLKQIDALLQK